MKESASTQMQFQEACPVTVNPPYTPERIEAATKRHKRTAKKNLTLIQTDAIFSNWEVLYCNGKKVAEGEYIDRDDFLKALGVEIEKIWIDNEDFNTIDQNGSEEAPEDLETMLSCRTDLSLKENGKDG